MIWYWGDSLALQDIYQKQKDLAICVSSTADIKVSTERKHRRALLLVCRQVEQALQSFSFYPPFYLNFSLSLSGFVGVEEDLSQGDFCFKVLVEEN